MFKNLLNTPSNYDFYTIIASLTAIIILTALFIPLINNFSWLTIGIFAAVALLILLALLQAPLSYKLTPEGLYINFLIKKQFIPYNDIEEVKKAKPHKGSFIYSTQGVFGYLGKTQDGTISFSTHLKNNILIKTKNKNYLISPKNINYFYDKIKSYKCN